ncbi:MAG TPA: metal-dependent transcriptional regulator, partial [Anaerolineae bacterium]
KRMVRQKLVRFDSSKQVHLTAKGHAIAERLQHRHRIVERWLTDVLGLDWAKSDAEAHHLEHAMSDEVAELLNKNLGYPTTCPHGNPIPGNVRRLARPNPKIIQLSAAKENAPLIVTRVSEYAENIAELLEYLGKRGVTPGAKLKVTKIAPLQGPLMLKVGARTTFMSRDVANFVWVKRE